MQQDAAHPACVLHVRRHVQPQPALELRPELGVVFSCTTRRFNHSEHEEVDDVAGDEAHREKDQDGDQKKGGNQQQDPPDDIRSHGLYRMVSDGAAPECSSVIAMITDWAPTASIELTESSSEPNPCFTPCRSRGTGRWCCADAHRVPVPRCSP